MTVTIYISLTLLLLYLVGLVIHRWIFLRDKRRMAAESRAAGRVIVKVDDLAPGAVRKFWLICQQYRLDAFLINHRGNFYAYVNRCRHMPTPLDFVRNEFVSEDGKFLRCYTHGALYEFATGRCVDGPCKGDLLYRLPVTIEGDEVLVGCPEGDLKPLAD